MRVRIWNAFASNNSGSYVIVGRFPTEALAAEVAAEWRTVVTDHTTWRAANEDKLTSESPLASYAKQLGLTYADKAYSDDWPQHSGAPEAWAIGHQVFVYSDYTVTMPSVIGQALYARGGRVDTELDHSHHALVVTFEIYFPRETPDVPARVQQLVDRLHDDALTTLRVPWHEPAWRSSTGVFGEPDLVVGAVFTDLAAGFAAVATATRGLRVRARIAEAHGHVDQLGHLRPSTPPTLRELVDVVLVDTGPARTGLAKYVDAIRTLGLAEAQLRIQHVPVTIVESVTPARGDEIAIELRAQGATVELRAT